MVLFRSPQTPYLALCLFMVLLSRHVQATSFQFVSSSCSKGNMALSDDSYTCEGGSCSSGETLTASGQVSLSSDLPDAYSVQVRVCKFRIADWNFICPVTKDVDLEVCGKVTNSISGDSCPSAGTYEFGFEEKLPGDDTLKVGSGYKIYLEADLIDTSSGDYFEKCTLVFDAVTSSTMTWSTSMAGAAALVALMGAGVALNKRRRRRRAIVSLDDEVEGGDKADFVEMKDQSENRGALV